MIRIILLIALSAIPIRSESAPPLPDREAFLQQVKTHLRSDRLLMSRYTYTEKTIEKQLDKNGNIRKTEEEIYEVYPSVEENRGYRRLIARNGKPLSAEELEKQDRKQDRILRERMQKREKESPKEKEKRLRREEEEREKEDRLIEELFRLYDIRMVGRETMEGHSVISLDFRPRPDARPASSEARMLMKIGGRAWFSESEFELVRLDVELLDNISVGLGMLAQLKKGAQAGFRRCKINDEIWLPAEARFTGKARILLLKGIHIDSRSQYSDFRKFEVQTSTAFSSSAPTQ